MNWDAVGAIAELLGAIGVIASLLYLAAQIRQNTRNLQAAAFDSSAQTLAEENRAFSLNPEFAELVERGNADYYSLSDLEKRRYRANLTNMFRLFESTFLKQKAGLLPAEQWQGFSIAARYMMRRPGWAQCWQEVREIYSEEFRSFLDSAVDEADHNPPST